MTHSSNLLRKKTYRRLEIPEKFVARLRVIDSDFKNRKVRVGAKVTMEELAEALLPHGWIVPVLPEFKGITVGGAISGAAIESTSGIYGQFNDCCLSYNIWNGASVLHVSKQEHSDLFYGIAGAYGCFGAILEAEISLVPTSGYLELRYETFSELEQAVEAISAAKGAVEALVYSEKRIVLVYAKEISKSEAEKLPYLNLSSSSSEWFYSHVDRVVKDRKSHEESIAIKDYLFRHDRGAFWMAGYGLSWPILCDYLLHKCGFQRSTLLPHVKPKNPGRIYRSLFGWFLDSQSLYRSLHRGGEGFFEKKVVVQDFYLPQRSAVKFIKHVLEKYQITPLWICPVLSTEKPQIFSPHLTEKQELLFDVGVYGIPYGCTASDAVKELEARTAEWKGKKMLYSQNYYSEETFWNLYSRAAYDQLRKKYTEISSLLDITEKVLQK